MAKFQPPSPTFIKARFFGGKQEPKAIVMHATVSSDDKGTARNIARWWAGATSPKSSAHYVRDPRETIQCVGDHTVAFHCGYNQDSIGYELCDEQVGPKSRWRDKDSMRILRGAAKDVARLCLAYDIEPKRPTLGELRSKGPHGIYGHDDSRRAFGHTTHTDPRDFPWAMFLRMVNRQIAKLRAEAEPTTKSANYRLHLMHASMLYSSSLRRKHEDLDKIFARAARRDVAWITGTEYGDDASRKLLRQVAKSYGYRTFWRGRDDVWIAVQRDMIKSKPEVEHQVVVPYGVGFGKKGPRGLLTVTFESIPELGEVTVAAAHLLTKGRPDGEGLYRTNLALNRKFTRAIGANARAKGAGRALYFYGGDQNIVDRENDTFMGAPLTSTWDELKKWENTGHGNIDVIASYDKDARVVGRYCRALDDGELPLHTDHFLVESGFDIRPLEG